MRNDLHEIKHPEYTESLFIEIELSKSKNIIVGVIYRPLDHDIKELTIMLIVYWVKLPKVKTN